MAQGTTGAHLPGNGIHRDTVTESPIQTARPDHRAEDMYDTQVTCDPSIVVHQGYVPCRQLAKFGLHSVPSSLGNIEQHPLIRSVIGGTF